MLNFVQVNKYIVWYCNL